MKKLFILLIFFITIRAYATTVGLGGYRDGGAFPAPQDPLWKTSNISSPIPFADWWTSILVRTNTDLLAAFPLYFRVQRSSGSNYGLAVQYAGIGKFYDQDFDECTGLFNDILDYVKTTNAPEIYIRAKDWNGNSLTTRLDAYSDWTVKMEIDDGTSKTNLVTLVKGSPFFYIETKNCEEEIYFSFPIKKTFTLSLTNAGLTISNPITNDHLAFYFTNRYYAVFSSSNTIFKMVNQNQIYISNFNNYLSIALLTKEEDLNTFYQSAYAFITNTRIVYFYDESTAEVTITYNLYTRIMRNTFSDEPLICLFPHHYKHTTASLLSIEYPTLRGTLKTFKGKSFNTKLKFYGILPYFPEPTASGYERTKLQEYINYAKSHIGISSSSNTYWAGKTFAKCAKLIPISSEIGDTSSRDYFINILKAELQDWYTYTGGETSKYYCYFDNWGTMIGYPAGFLTWKLCDHHFHYGYFIYSSAILSMFDASFISQYGGMVELLIRDVNSPYRDDSMFGYLNYLDIYEGHCWADGYADHWTNKILNVIVDEGNNQESSSEAMNFWVGVYLWGLITHNNTYRDLGIFGYVLENSAINEYYFDKDEEIFHPDYRAKHCSCTILWGGKYQYNIWWCMKDPEWMHIIEWIPVTPSSMYLGYDPVYAQKNYNEMIMNDPTPESESYDIIWKYEALFDPDDAINKFHNKDISNLDSDLHSGNTKAEVYNFLYNMKGFGRVSTEYYADFPSYNVFNNNGDITYVAYNPDSIEKTINFYKNGELKYSLKVPPLSSSKYQELQQKISIGNNIQYSILFPNPFNITKYNNIKFCIYKNNRIQGFPEKTKVYIYNIIGDLIWVSKNAEDYDNNIIICDKNILEEKKLVNEVLICLIKNSNSAKRLKLVVIK